METKAGEDITSKLGHEENLLSVASSHNKGQASWLSFSDKYIVFAGDRDTFDTFEPLMHETSVSLLYWNLK